MNLALSNKLWIRFIIIFTICTAINLFVFKTIWTKNLTEVQHSEVQFAFSAIESGPLEFAKLYSFHLASEHIKRIFTEPQIVSRGFLGAEITIEEKLDDPIAKWYTSEVQNLPDKCIVNFTKNHQNPEDLLNYTIAIKLNRCNNHLLSLKLSTLAGLAILFAFVFSTLSILYFYLPVMKSIKNAFIELNSDSPEINESKIPYKPIYKLIAQAIEAKNIKQLKFIEDLSKKVAHDIRSPLSALQILANTCAELPLSKRKLLTSATDRITDITSDLLKPSTNKQSIRKNIPTDIRKPINDLINEKRLEYFNKNFHLEFNMSSEINISIDINKLKTVLSNLLNNSYEANSTSVTISAKLDEHFAVLLIEDNGDGIDEDVLKNIVSRKFSTKSTGHGIGLFSAFEFIRSLNGDIEIKSSENGTIIKITIPLN